MSDTTLIESNKRPVLNEKGETIGKEDIDNDINKIDILNRDEFVEKLFTVVEALSANRKNSTFAIDGKWGCGKSFVVNMFEEKIKDIQLEENSLDKYLLFHYDCWKYDYYEEPLVAIAAAMLDFAEDEFNFWGKKGSANLRKSWITVKETLKGITEEAVDNYLNLGLIKNLRKALEKANEEEEKKTNFDKYKSFKDTLTQIRNELTELAQKRTVVLVVDELDRCLPEYTIKVLERLHHMFSGIENIIVILAVDKSQLAKTVTGIYAVDVNKENPDEVSDYVNAYLRKFIDFEMPLDFGSVNEGFIKKYKSYISYFNKDLLNGSDEVFNFVFQLFKNIEIRVQDKLLKKAELIHNIVFEDRKDVDYAVMLSEIICVVMKYKKIDGNQNLALDIVGRKKSKNRLSYAEKEIYDIFEEKINNIEFFYCTFTYYNEYLYAKRCIDMNKYNFFEYFLAYWFTMYKVGNVREDDIFMCNKNVINSKNNIELKKFKELSDIIN